MSEINVLFDRNRRIKDPVFVAVERLLKQRVEMLRRHDPEDELEIALERYTGLLAGDVHIEPIIGEAGEHKVCISSRKTGFLRADMDVYPLGLPEILAGLGETMQTVITVHDVLGLFLEKNPDVKYVNCIENGRLYAFVPGVDAEKEVKDLISGIFFNTVVLEQLNVEGNVPNDYCDQVIKIGDGSLINKAGSIHLISYQFAEELVKGDRISVSLVPNSGQIMFTENTQFVPGNLFQIQVSYGDESNHGELALESLTWDIPGVHVEETGLQKTPDGTYTIFYRGWYPADADFDVLQGEVVFSTTKPSDSKKILSNRVKLKDVVAGYLPGRFEIQNPGWVNQTKNAEFIIHDRCTDGPVHDENWKVTLDGSLVPVEKVIFVNTGYQLVDQVTAIKAYPLSIAQGRRLASGEFTVTPSPEDVVITETKNALVGSQLSLQYLHKYAGLDIPVETFVWDGVLTTSEGIKTPVNGYGYDPKTGKLWVTLDVVIPDEGQDATYRWGWIADAGPCLAHQYTGEKLIAGSGLWMTVNNVDAMFDWDAQELTVTSDIRYRDGSLPDLVTADFPAIVTGPVDGSTAKRTYYKDRGELVLVFSTTVPDEGATVSIKVKLKTNIGKFGQLECTKTIGQKSTMTVAMLGAALDLAAERLTWTYKLDSKSGEKYDTAKMAMPALVATNTVGGTLEASSQTFDKVTQTGTVVFPVVVTTDKDTVYSLEGVITGGTTGRESVAWQFTQPATGGYSVTPLAASITAGVITQKLQVNNKDGKKASRANIITLDVAVGVDPNDPHPKDQMFNPVDQTHTFKLTTPQTPGTVQQLSFGGDLFVDDVPIPFRVDHVATQYVPETAGSSATHIDNGRAYVELRFMQNSQESTKDFRATLISLTNGATTPDFRFERKQGSTTRWIYSAAVKMPAGTPLNYDFVVKFDYTDNLLDVSVNHSQRVTQNYEKAGTARLVRELCVMEDKGEVISGVNPAGDLTMAYEIKLKDGTFPKSCKIKRPMETVSYAVGTDFPQKETYDPATGILRLTAKVYLRYTEDRDFWFTGVAESVSPNSIQAADFRDYYSVPRRRKLAVIKTGESTNAARTELTVNYKASHEDGTLPLDVQIVKPFSRTGPADTVVGTTPIKESYDPATGQGSFTFKVTPKVDGEVDCTFITSFTSAGLQPVSDLRITAKLAAMAGFKATQKSAVYDESTSRIRITYVVKNAANEFPPTCTMTDANGVTSLESATNTLNGGIRPAQSGYNVKTGEYYYDMVVVKGTVSGETLPYKFVGTLTVPEQIIKVTFDAPAYKYKLVPTTPTIENPGAATIRARQIFTVTREGVSGNVKTIAASDLACAKKDPVRDFSQTVDNSGMLFIYTPVTTPETTKRTYYTTTGNVVITTPEGMVLRLPFSSVAIAYVPTESGQADNRLISMDLVGSEMTVVIQSYWSGAPSKRLYGGVLELPMSAAYNIIPADPKTPTFYAWNDADSTLTFKFNVQTPTAGNAGYYYFRGRLNYPEYASYTTDEFEVSKTFPLPEAIVAATYVDSTLVGDVLTSTYLLKAPNGAKATTATMGKLDATVNAFDNSLSLLSETYDPATGLYRFSVKVKTVGLRTTMTYRMQGTVTTNTGKLALDRTHTSHSYTLANAGVKWVTERLQLNQTVIRTSDDTAVEDATFLVTNLPKAIAGKVPYSEHEKGSGAWYTHLIVALPADTGVTKYTGNGNFVVNQVDGLKVYIPWTLDYDSQPYPSNTVRTVELWDITWAANTVTFLLKAQNPGRANPPDAVMTPPIYRVYTPVQQQAAIPTNQSYDVNTGLLSITFTGTAPTAIPTDYLIEGDVYFPSVSPTEKQGINLKRPLTNKMNPNGTR